MTKRDYILLVEVIKRFNLPDEFLNELADALHKQNPRFNRQRFLLESKH